MCGFMFGLLFFAGAMFVMRRNHHARSGFGGRFGSRWDSDDWGERMRGDDGWERGFPRGRRMNRRLRWLFERLDTTPGQEKAILAVLDAAQERARTLRHDLHGTRRDLASLFSSDTLDRTALDEQLAAPKRALDEHLGALAEMIADLHGVLDERQRRQLARWLAR